MRYIRQHADTILESYRGDMPLSHFLKAYFKKYPILGSRDRRIISAMIYTWFRCAKGVANDDLLRNLMDQWIDEKKLLTTPLPELLTRAAAPFDPMALLPYNIALSEGIGKTEWLQSMLVQPALFIRIRKDTEKITGLLNSHQIPFKFITDTCLSMPNGAKTDALLPPDSYVIQDASSQQTGTWFMPHKNESWYDCCAGAGGKSLLLKDMEPLVGLTVSDKRDSIIHNLKQRFKLYHHSLPAVHIADASDKQQLDNALGEKQFDSIICDAPCSGSGTWSRTPEQLYFFRPEYLAAFSSLQKKIAVNVANHLKRGGKLYYITCSVFKAENEEITDVLTGQGGMQLVRSKIINGIGIHADSMFIAEIRKLPGADQ